jgi:integrase
MQAKITKRLVEGLRPQDKAYSVRDTELKGFVLRVRPNGGMTWFFDYRNSVGRRLNFKIGTYPGLQPEGARDQAKQQAGKVGANIDVQAEKKAKKAAADRAKVSTLRAFIEHRYGPWALAHLRRGDVAVARLKADFEKWLDEPLSTFNAWRMESWRRDRIKEGTKPVTLNRQIDTLRAALSKAIDWGVIDTHPLQGLKRLKVDDDERVRYLSAAEENRLRAALVQRETNLREARVRFNQWLDARGRRTFRERTEEFIDHIRPMTITALNTGLRRGELLSLRWADIDLNSAMLTVRAAAAKSGDSRRIPLNAEVLAVLEGWQKQTKGEGETFVFAGDEGRRMTNINKGWATVCKLGKLTDFRFHDCRHHFASRLVQKGVDLNTVRELMGHADLKMTLRYSHLKPENLAAAVAKLG